MIRPMPLPYVVAMMTLCLFFCPMHARADVKADVGFDRLQSEMGDILPNGQGVPVSQIEGLSNYHWMPDTSSVEFTGKIIVDVDSDSGTSGHATSVGKLFYGNTSGMAYGVDTIHAYYASDWMQRSYLGALGWGGQPLTSSSRIANHSWVATLPSVYCADILRRVDWVVETDEYVQVVGLTNGSGNQELLSHGFNVIAVGRTDGNHPRETLPTDEVYMAGRILPTVVAPMTTTSSATPVVASAAALLVATGKEPELSTDPVSQFTQNRNGDWVYNAERSEVIKAAIMGGADRYTRNTNTGEITDYREAEENRSVNGLDQRYGAGQVNVYNSFAILSGGEQNSAEDEPAGNGLIGPVGFDYDPEFGGADGSNATASYYLTADTEHTLLSIALVWNLKVDGGSMNKFNGAVTLYDLDIVIYDRTEGGLEVAASRGSYENTENIHVSLLGGHEYLLHVTSGHGLTDFKWDFALAWQTQADSDGDMTPDLLDDFPDDSSERRDADADFMGDNFEQRIIDADDADTYSVLEDVLPEDDFDGDGITNLDEFVDGSDPTQYDLLGDINGDCRVNMADYFALADNWGTLGENEADLNGDERVNMADYFILADNWLCSCP